MMFMSVPSVFRSEGLVGANSKLARRPGHAEVAEQLQRNVMIVGDVGSEKCKCQRIAIVVSDLGVENILLLQKIARDRFKHGGPARAYQAVIQSRRQRLLIA